MTTPAVTLRHEYGRFLEDFQDGAIYQHPFEVTVDAALAGPYLASFLETTPTWTSDKFAHGLHPSLTRRPLSPHLLLNLALSLSVHDVSQQAIAHLGYVRVSFPKPLLLGGTVRAASQVLGTRRSASGDRGIVHVHTVLTDEEGHRVLDFERKALVRARSPDQPLGRPALPDALLDCMGHLPPREFAELLADRELNPNLFRPKLWGNFEDFAPGQVLVHTAGRTVGDSEAMQLSTLLRNTHPLHTDAIYCQDSSFQGQRVVYGGLVLAWTLAQAAIDLGGHVLWEIAWTDGAHPNPVLAGDTIYAATQVLRCEAVSAHAGVVELRMVGVKNRRPGELLAAGVDLFTAELGKPAHERVVEKVVEFTREMLVRRR